jgi:hypothetical protein
MNSVFGIDTRIIEVLACIQTSQIGGSFESGTPVTDDVVARGEVQSASSASRSAGSDSNRRL